MGEYIEQVSVDLIDDPHAPMRTQMNDEKLTELSHSISTQGLIQPITLRKVGERYEVVAGHRRFKATKLAGLVVISAIVRQLDEAGTDSIRMHENLYREDINPVDEGRYIRKMIDDHHYDPEDLSVMTGKSEAYLRARYDLLDYPVYLLEAVEQEKIGLGAAGHLVKITNEQVRRDYTHFAKTSGITAKRAEAWYRSWELGNLPRDPASYVAPEEETNFEPVALKMPCNICGREDDIEGMAMHYAHSVCTLALVQARKKEVKQDDGQPF